jgi:hypothetical protein
MNARVTDLRSDQSTNWEDMESDTMAMADRAMKASGAPDAGCITRGAESLDGDRWAEDEHAEDWGVEDGYSFAFENSAGRDGWLGMKDEGLGAYGHECIGAPGDDGMAIGCAGGMVREELAARRGP